ncbi:MAG: serine hydrolase, partial [Candidatus Aminicenantes bacterium]
MKKSLLVLLLFLMVNCLVFLSGCTQKKYQSFLGTGTYTGAYWPTAAWKTCKPEEVGMDSDKLYKVYEYAANPDINTWGIAIIRRGYIVGEAYFEGFSASSRFPSYSIAKSFLSSLFGIAIDKNLIKNIDELVTKYLVEWLGPEHEQEKRRMTIRHLLTMSSGLEWNEQDYYSGGHNDAYIMGNTYDHLAYVLAKPSIHEPGTEWNYS